MTQNPLTTFLDRIGMVGGISATSVMTIMELNAGKLLSAAVIAILGTICSYYTMKLLKFVEKKMREHKERKEFFNNIK